MKKAIALLLCLLMACGMLTGCGGPKIPPENFPHSETLRLNSTVDEVIQSENLQESEYIENNYYVSSVTIDGTEVAATYVSRPGVDRMSVSYGFFSDDASLEREYQHFLKYFSTLYGEGSEGASGPIHFPEDGTAKAHEWTYILDDEDYLIILVWQLSPDSTLDDNLSIRIFPVNFYDS